ncbi:MAG: hypothetical protein H6556_23110 [Lewinellaceae bacterium]|nr:hypothetical protein [Lewinellaceae bacterium]
MMVHLEQRLARRRNSQYRETLSGGEPSPEGPQAPESSQTYSSNTGSPNPESRKPPTFTDPRDGRTYRTVELNGLRWMAENLNFDVGTAAGFMTMTQRMERCTVRLYTWAAAQKACPPGWRLPTDEEWRGLNDSFGGEKEAYKALIVGGHSGFEVLLEGHHRYSAFWTSEEISTDRAVFWGFYFPDKLLYRNHEDKHRAFSCRCVREI